MFRTKECNKLHGTAITSDAIADAVLGGVREDVAGIGSPYAAVMRATGASLRTVKGWFGGEHSIPSIALALLVRTFPTANARWKALTDPETHEQRIDRLEAELMATRATLRGSRNAVAGMGEAGVCTWAPDRGGMAQPPVQILGQREEARPGPARER